MPLWGKIDRANNAPKFDVTDKGHSTTGILMYGNTSVGAAVNKQVNGVYGLSPGESTRAHTGWVLRREGTGPVLSLNIVAGGTGYSNSGVVTVSGGTVNATANVTTNGSGVITGFTNLTSGEGFKNVANTTIAISGGGTGANITVTLGGRAGRVHEEVLVATGSIV